MGTGRFVLITIVGLVLAAGFLGLASATHADAWALVGLACLAVVGVAYSAWHAGDARTWLIWTAGTTAVLIVVVAAGALAGRG